MNFFLDIFNQLLKVNEENILIIFDLDGDIWFALRDVYKVLGYNNIDKVINKTNINTKNKEYYANIRVCPRGQTLYNNQPNQVFVNEAGLYEVLLKSNKPLAEVFTYKLLTDIIVPLGRIRSEQSPELCQKLGKKVNIY